MKKKIIFMLCIMTAICLATGCGQKNTSNNNNAKSNAAKNMAKNSNKVEKKEVKSATYLMADLEEGDHPTKIACDKFASMVKDKTDGRVNIEVYHGDIIGTEKEQGQQITVGGIDFAVLSGSLGDYDKKLKKYQELYSYGSEDDMWNAVSKDGADDLLSSSGLTQNNIIGLSWFHGGSYNFYNNKRAVTTPADIAGMKVASYISTTSDFLESSGAESVDIPYSDMYDSLKNYIADGEEGSLASYVSSGHYKVAKYVTIDSHIAIPQMLVVSKTALAAMTKEDQETVKKCAKEVSESQIKDMVKYEKKAMDTIKKAGCKITELNDSQKSAFREKSQTANDELQRTLTAAEPTQAPYGKTQKLDY